MVRFFLIFNLVVTKRGLCVCCVVLIVFVPVGGAFVMGSHETPAVDGLLRVVCEVRDHAFVLLNIASHLCVLELHSLFRLFL
jgi:hypothetical protein